jgi:uncharacterized protein YjbI with pentapeptide repeats
MARKDSATPQPPRLPRPRPLDDHDGTALEPGQEYDGVRFADLDLGEQAAPDARLIGCALARCALDGCGLQGSSFVEVTIDGLRSAAADLADAQWTDVAVADSRLAGTELRGAVLKRVVFRDCKLDAVNFRTASLLDVTFERCVLDEPDFGSATLRRVRFDACRLLAAGLSGAKLEDVDLRGSELGIDRGHGSLGGAIVDTNQLVALAPALARHLGITVLDQD